MHINTHKMMYKGTLLSFVLCCGITLQSNAQHYLGVATGQYSAINNLYLNPASLSDCKEKIVVNLFSLNAAFDNSLGSFSKLGDLGSADGGTFNMAGKEPFSMVLPSIQMRLPAVMVSLNNKLKQTFALTTRVRAVNQFNHFDPSLYNTVKSDDHVDQDYHFVTSNFNWTAHVWSEVGLSYAMQIFESGPHQVKGGITLRYLAGVNYLGLKGKNLDVSYKQGNDTVFATNSDIQFASNAVSADNAFSNGVNASSVLNSLFGAKAGSGFGMDIGVTYTYMIGADDLVNGENANSGDVHRLTASAAIIDIGSIKYKTGNNFVVNVTGNGNLTGKGLEDHLGDYNDFRSYVMSQGFTVDTGSFATKVYMPTAMVLGVDYQIYKSLYVNATYIANLANRLNYGTSYYNILTVVPRFENKFFTIGVPISYSGLAKDVKMGLGIRISGFFFGSDDMLALMSSNQHGLNFYFGGYVPIYKKHKKNKV